MNNLMLTVAAEIDEHHRLAHLCIGQANEHARQAGVLLLQQKAALPHGEWLPWLAANVSFSARTAARYMNTAAPAPKLDRLTNLHRAARPKPGSKRARMIEAIDRVRRREDLVAHAAFVLVELPVTEGLKPDDIQMLRRLRDEIGVVIGLAT